MVLRYNIERKKILHNHLKLLKVMRATLERISIHKETFSRATFKRVKGVEEFDDDREVFKRRMGLRHYFKELRMNMARIKKAKESRSGTASQDGAVKPEGKKKASKKSKKPAAAGEGEEEQKSPEAKEKKPKTAAEKTGKSNRDTAGGSSKGPRNNTP